MAGMDRAKMIFQMNKPEGRARVVRTLARPSGFLRKACSLVAARHENLENVPEQQGYRREQRQSRGDVLIGAVDA